MTKNNSPKTKSNQPDVRMRTLVYRRAIWQNTKTTLEDKIFACFDILKTTEERTFDHNDGQIQCLSAVKDPEDGGFFLHLSFCRPDKPTSVIPKPSTSIQQSPIPYDPPKGKDFMDGDLTTYINKNNVVICPSSVNEGLLNTYLHYVFAECKQDDWVIDLKLSKIANISKIKLLKKEGVKRIHLGASLFKETAKELDEDEQLKVANSFWASLTEPVLEKIRALLTIEKGIDYNELEKESAINIKLLISYNARKKANTVSQQTIEELAKSVVDENDDGFIIETTTGKKVKQNEIVVSEPFSISASGNSVDVKEAWAALKRYYLSLKKGGILSK